jgi:hypothetical protein
VTAETRVSLDQLGAVAVGLIEQADQDEIRARVIGSTAIYLHCEAAAQALSRADRAGKDLDLIVGRRDRKRMRALLETNGYEIDRDVLVAMEGSRYSFEHPESGVGLDVFFDRMEFCHTIDLSDRLAEHDHTVAIEDLLLSKLQVRRMTPNDLSDAISILATHRVGTAADPEVIDAGYVAGLLARDWGFHHTVVANLDALVVALPPAAERLGAEGLERVREGAAALGVAIDAEKKTRSWRIRAKVGERVQWWEDVDDNLEAY